MSMGVHQPYHLDLCADDEDPSQLIIRPGWDAPHVRCFPMTFCAWPCLLRQVGTVLGSPYDYVVAGLAYANPGSRQSRTKPIPDRTSEDVARNLKAARRQLDALLDSACRSGVQASLAIVASWYPTIDLELLRALREHSEADVGAVWTKICHLAAELTHAMDLLEYTPLLDDAGQPIPCSDLSNMQYTSSDDTEGEAAPGDHAESSRSRYLDDEDGDDEEGAGSSAEHSETAVPPSTQAKATATSASDDAARTNPAAPTSGDAPNTEAAPDATGSDAPNA